MPTLFSLDTFLVFSSGGSVTGVTPVTVAIQGSDDLAYTFVPDAPGATGGVLDVTTGEEFGILVNGSPVFLDSSAYSTEMARVSHGGSTTDAIVISNATSGQSIVIPLGGDQIGASSPPSIAEADTFLSGSFAPIPGGTFAPGSEFDVAAVPGVTGEAQDFGGTNGDDTIDGFLSDDLITGQGGDDSIDGGEGNDTLDGGAGNDTINGGPGLDDVIGGSGQPPVLDSLTDGDSINPGGAFDLVSGTVAEFGDDTINGIDFGDQILIENVAPGAVSVAASTSFSATVEIAGAGDDPAATFFLNMSPGADAADLLVLDSGADVIIQLDPDAAYSPGIGAPVSDRGDFDQIADFLFDIDGFEPSEVLYTGAAEGIALLEDGYEIKEISGDLPNTVVSITRGIYLSSGDGPGTENTSGSFSRTLNEPGDSRFTQVAQDAFPNAGDTNDASFVTVRFDASAFGDQPSIQVPLIFASEEFPEFVDSSFVDIAALIMNGVNYALFDGDPEQPLSIVGESINTAGNFYSNTGDDGSDTDPFTGTFDTEFDGFSVVVNVIAPIQPGMNELVIGVADTGDFIYDSGLFVGPITGSDFETTGSFIDVNGTNGDDIIEANAAPELVELGQGADEVQGTPDELDGDVIDGFGNDDQLTFEGVTFGIDDVQVTLGSAILDVDTDGDDTPDTTVTLQGNFDSATFSVENDGGNSVVTASGVVDTSGPGTEGDDVLEGSALDDSIAGLGGDDRIEGLAGDDTLDGGAGNDGLLGGADDDSLIGGSGDDNIAASGGDDVVSGGTGNDFIGGGLGNDTVDAGDDNDTIGGGDGDDDIDGGAGDDVVAGGAGNDMIEGGTGDDTMGASFGADTVTGGAGADSLGGGTGRDEINGQAGADSIGGGEGDDTVAGGGGDDFLAGGGRDDVVNGGTGNDTINGGDGSDVMRGGEGADVFVWNSASDGAVDRVLGFEDGLDSFLLTGVDNAPGSGLQGRVDALNIVDATIGGVAGVSMTYNGQIIEVTGVSAAELGVDDFQFL